MTANATATLDHRTAQDAAASRLDGGLEPGDSAALEEHLAGCPTCRRIADGLDADARDLRALDLGPVPVAVRADVAIAAERGARGGHIGRWVGLAAVGALLVAMLGSGALGGSGGSGPAQSPDVRVHWKTDVVELQAGDVAVTANGLTFSPIGPATEVRSDPGNATDRTLEVTWREHGVEQRIFVYLHNDERTWWAGEIRIYDGTADPTWLTARGRFFEAPMGQPWRGDADIPFADPKAPGVPAALRLRDATLAISPSNPVAAPPGGGIRLPEAARPFAPGGPLYCSGILQLSPRQAQAALIGLGYRVSWRYFSRTDYVDLLDEPPEGTVIIDDGPFVGTDGQLLIAVDEPSDENSFERPPYPADCPGAGPNAVGPEASPTPTP